jgi:hypothetical protein
MDNLCFRLRMEWELRGNACWSPTITAGMEASNEQSRGVKNEERNELMHHLVDLAIDPGLKSRIRDLVRPKWDLRHALRF